MKPAEAITRAIDFLYVGPIRRIIPLETFRYAVCGGVNMALGSLVIYPILYRYVVDGRFLDLGIVMMSPHILTLFMQYPITFFAGFWLNRHVTFTLSTLKGGTQLFRYLLQSAGSFLLNYLLMKLLVEVADIYAPVARPITDLIVVVYSYLAAKFFTFRTGGRAAGRSDETRRKPKA